MEVSTVSPSPASPTEGDDLCETDVTSVAIHSVILLICLCGLAGNGAVLWLLSLKTGNRHFFYMAFMDFLFLLFAIPSALLILVEDMSCSTILPLMYMNFVFQLSVVSYYRALMSKSTVLYMDKLCWLCCRCHLPERLMWVVDSFRYWAFFGLFTVIPSMTFLCPSHQEEHCQAALISMYTITLLLFAAPVVISGIIDFIKAQWGYQQQQPKRRDIVTYLVVLFSLLLTICNILQQFGYVTVPSQVLFLLASINNSIKPFIYFLVGRCWRPCSIKSLRLSLQRVFEEPKEKTTHSDGPAMNTVL
ncbi:mas-related G-protein coupled receptor member H-like isoform X2 [Zonotrichia leucophrys gambelii]|uniref:mas-related G-protein coupled receptor member H-like isoform X2 n=1 Tax=Zonotrichia leucophrys gambelii TaxID=257770 RepID=UPI003140563A